MRHVCENCKYWGSTAAEELGTYTYAPCTSKRSPAAFKMTEKMHSCPIFDFIKREKRTPNEQRTT